MKKLLLSIFSLAVCIVGQEIFAAQPNTLNAALQEFTLKPRFNIWGETGSHTLGKGQVLLPFGGDQSKAVFGVLEGNAVAHDGSWLAGVGLGYRQLVNDNIYGAYVTVDHNVSRNKNGFWIASPGVEILGNVWDFHLNAYIPFGDGKKDFVTVGWGESYGTGKKFVQYKEYSGYDAWVKKTDFESAAHGVDLRIARVIPRFEDAKLYVGGYYFKGKDISDIRGALLKLRYSINQYAAFELTDSYDNYNRNKAMVGLMVTLGGYSKAEKKQFGLSSRLLDPIEHGYSDTIVPIKKGYGKIDILTTMKVKHDNLRFIKKSSTLQPEVVDNIDPLNQSQDVVVKNGNNSEVSSGDGTYANPFTNLDARAVNMMKANQNVGVIDPSPLLYFGGPGDYYFKGISGNSNDNIFVVPPGWSMWGRTQDFTESAVGNQQPVFHGVLMPAGNNIIDSARFLYYAPNDNIVSEAVVVLNNAKKVEFNNTTIGVNDPRSLDSFATGVSMKNSELILRNTSVSAADNNEALVTGIRADDHSIVELAGGVNNISANLLVESVDGQNAVDKKAAVVSGAKVAQEEQSFVATAIVAMNGSTINFRGSESNIVAESFGDNINVSQLGALAISAKSSNVNFYTGNNSIFATVSADNNSTIGNLLGSSIAITDKANVSFYNGNNTVVANTSLINSNSDAVIVTGLSATGSSACNLFDGENNIGAFSVSGESTAKTVSATAVNVMAGSLFNVKGGKNNIVAYLQDQNSYVDYPSSIGILANEKSTVVLDGGENNIYVSGAMQNTINSVVINSMGILANNNSEIHVLSGANVINAAFDVYGIGSTDPQTPPQVAISGVSVVNNSLLNFVGKQNEIKITTPDPQYPYTISYGVVATADSRLATNGYTIAKSIAGLTGLLNYVNPIQYGKSSIGAQIAWEGVAIPWK